MRIIIWTNEAEPDYSANIDYLLKEWTISEAEEFINKAENFYTTLRQVKLNAKLPDLME